MPGSPVPVDLVADLTNPKALPAPANMSLLLKVRGQPCSSAAQLAGWAQHCCLPQDIGTLATFSELGDIQDAAVYSQGSSIEWVGRTCDLPERYQAADTVLSLPDRVVLPGLINTHHVRGWARLLHLERPGR